MPLPVPRRLRRLLRGRHPTRAERLARLGMTARPPPAPAPLYRELYLADTIDRHDPAQAARPPSPSAIPRGGPGGPRIRRPGYNVVALRQQAYACPEFRAAMIAIREEVFRRGIEVVPAYDRRCPRCGTEYVGDEETCADCGVSLEAPDPAERARLERWLERANHNGQTLLDVCKTAEDGLQTLDLALLVLRKHYWTVGGRLYSELVEVVPGEAEAVEGIWDEHGVPGGLYYVCPMHRDQVRERPEGDAEWSPGDCPTCGYPLQDVHYVALGRSWRYTRAAASMDDIGEYYIEGEVIAQTKYTTSLIPYPVPPPLTLWPYIRGLSEMTDAIWETYLHRRTPSGALFITAENPDTVRTQIEEARDKAVYTPTEPSIICVPPDETQGRRIAEYIEFFPSPKEFQYGEIRREFRLAIARFFGLPELFASGEAASAGGAAMEVLAHNRMVTRSQRLWNEEILPRITAAAGVRGWRLQLRPAEERDEAAELERARQWMMLAEAGRQLGLTVDLDPAGDPVGFRFSGEVQPAPEAGAGLGGLFGPLGGPSIAGTGEGEAGAESMSGAPYGLRGQAVSDQSAHRLAERPGGMPPGLTRGAVPEDAVRLAPGEQPPAGAQVVVGPRGGRYYIPAGGEGGAPGQPESEAEWRARLPEWVREDYPAPPPADKIPRGAELSMDDNGLWGVYVAVPGVDAGRDASILPVANPNMRQGWQVRDTFYPADIEGMTELAWEHFGREVDGAVQRLRWRLEDAVAAGRYGTEYPAEMDEATEARFEAEVEQHLQRILAGEEEPPPKERLPPPRIYTPEEEFRHEPESLHSVRARDARPAETAVRLYEKRVEKRGDKWCTVHCHGPQAGEVIACFDTREEALAQHRAIMARKAAAHGREVAGARALQRRREAMERAARAALLRPVREYREEVASIVADVELPATATEVPPEVLERLEAAKARLDERLREELAPVLMAIARGGALSAGVAVEPSAAGDMGVSKALAGLKKAAAAADAETDFEVGAGAAAALRPGPTALSDEVLWVLVHRSPVWESFAGVSNQAHARMVDALVKVFSGEVPFELQEQMEAIRAAHEEAAALAWHRIETIARTETAAIANSARMEAYKARDPEGKYLYAWSNPLDHRTTDVCRDIVAEVRRRGGAVPLETLREIVDAAAEAHGYRPRPWVPHFNCRSGPYRVVI